MIDNVNANWLYLLWIPIILMFLALLYQVLSILAHPLNQDDLIPLNDEISRSLAFINKVEDTRERINRYQTAMHRTDVVSRSYQSFDQVGGEELV
jgi:hypothetical protein